MAYCRTKEREKTRFNAVQEVLREHKKPAEVARRFGVAGSTIGRWLERFLELQEAREVSLHTRHIPTKSSRLKHSPNRISEDLVFTIIEVRLVINRYAEVVHQELLNQGCQVSLSAIRCVIKQSRLVKEKSRWVRHRKFSKRPEVKAPGDLVEVDIVHFYHPITKQRAYATTIIDLYTRMVYVKIYEKMSQKNSLQTVLEAREKFGFAFQTIQTDNGGEFGKWFQNQVVAHGMAYRRTRVRRPNDNAHIERFNRTLREECLGNYLPVKESLYNSQARVDRWLDYYNHNRLHLSLQLMALIQMLRR